MLPLMILMILVAVPDLLHSAAAISLQLPQTANLSSTWVVNNHTLQTSYFLRPILSSRLAADTSQPLYLFGFRCGGIANYSTYIFSVFIDYEDGLSFRQVWSANQNNPVRDDATLQLTSDGNLVLTDVDGTLAWSSKTAGLSVAGLNMTQAGNLVLYNVSGGVVWQSFDHPTDTLLPGQKLVEGQKLTSSVSDSDWRQGLYYVALSKAALSAWIKTDPPLPYFIDQEFEKYVVFHNGSLDTPGMSYQLPSSAQFIQLKPDGHLKAFQKIDSFAETADIYASLAKCRYPLVCGEYGICTGNKNCSCLGPIGKDSTSYFREKSEGHPDQGCSAITPISCNASKFHRFVRLESVTYFPIWMIFDYDDFEPLGSQVQFNISMDQCRERCLKNCSCKAAIYIQEFSNSNHTQRCYLPTEILSLYEDVPSGYNVTMFIKVQSARKNKNLQKKVVVGISIGGSFLLVAMICATCFIIRMKQKANQNEEDYLDHVPGMPLRMSYNNLRIATGDFDKKLGQGGFGSVFEGVLEDGTKIAVKRLDGIGQVKRSFLAEVESIGSIHHVNLVRLVGFCAENSHRLLVYEYMTNGSLDGWIYNRGQMVSLYWKSRKKIIKDVAKGLAYLHEECRQKIIHLDIKPQNILIDEAFNAKLSDFGLAKLIDRNQSKVVTTMRGTPGYLAPEWLSAVITEKVDVYSFGVVLLEILCGRKQFEVSEPEERRHLLSLFKIKAEKGELLDLVDRQSEDMRSHAAEVVEMMHIAAWCLQSECSKRPSMSMVVKVLEGVAKVEKDADFSLLHSQISAPTKNETRIRDSSNLLPSILTGPRVIWVYLPALTA